MPRNLTMVLPEYGPHWPPLSPLWWKVSHRKQGHVGQQSPVKWRRFYFLICLWRPREAARGERSGDYVHSSRGDRVLWGVSSQVQMSPGWRAAPQPCRGTRTGQRTSRWYGAWHTGCGSCLCFPFGRLWGPAASGWSRLSFPWLCEPAAGRAEAAPETGCGRETKTLQIITVTSKSSLKASQICGRAKTRALANKLKCGVLKDMLKKFKISKVRMCYIIYYLWSSKYVLFRVENKGR